MPEARADPSWAMARLSGSWKDRGPSRRPAPRSTATARTPTAPAAPTCSAPSEPGLNLSIHVRRLRPIGARCGSRRAPGRARCLSVRGRADAEGGGRYLTNRRPLRLAERFW